MSTKCINVYCIRQYIPHKEFRIAVSQTYFGRVCPKCGKQWSESGIFVKETSTSGEMELVRGIPVVVYRCQCGGEMLIDRGTHLVNRKDNRHVKVERDPVVTGETNRR